MIKRVMVIAGEASGDLLAAELIRSLREAPQGNLRTLPDVVAGVRRLHLGNGIPVHQMSFPPARVAAPAYSGVTRPVNKGRPSNRAIVCNLDDFFTSRPPSALSRPNTPILGA